MRKIQIYYRNNTHVDTIEGFSEEEFSRLSQEFNEQIFLTIKNANGNVIINTLEVRKVVWINEDSTR